MASSMTYEYGTGPVRAAPATSRPEYHPASFEQTPRPFTAVYSSAPSDPTITAASINQANQHQQLQLYRGDQNHVGDRRMTPYVAPAAPAVHRDYNNDAYYQSERAPVRYSEGRKSGGRSRARRGKGKGASRREYEEYRPTLGDTMVMIIRVVVDAIKTPSGKR